MITGIILLVVALWWWSGWKKIPTGHRGLLTILGSRTHWERKERWRWAAWPLGLIPVNCKQQIMPLGVAEFTTRDNLTVFVDGTVAYKVCDLYQYLDVEESEIEHGIDEKRTEVLRTEIRKRPMKEVLDLADELGKHVKEAVEHEDWGIDIKHVVISSIKPDPKTLEALALQAREELERKGQRVEKEHFGEMVADFEKPKKEGGKYGFTHEEAYEAALYITGKADPKKMYGLDAATATAMAKVFGRII
ncbi:MAG: SPFH domain-containing protein [bacterium]|nr:SPFH domain-containing protein [bacterium]